MRKLKKWVSLCVLGCFFVGAFSFSALAENTTGPSEFWLQEKGSAAQPETLAAGAFPRVLLLGDSISSSYEAATRELLAEKAIVYRPPGNCQSTVFGLVNIEEWLGDESWDVIHFNWGIWDAHHLAGDRFRTTHEEYEQNLRTLVSRLKATGAKMIWASTTPLMGRIDQGGIWVEGAEIPARNDIARQVMNDNGILINDLYEAMLPHAPRLHTEDGCHFTPEGYAFLAQHVAESVERILKANEEDEILMIQDEDGRNWAVFPKEATDTWQFAGGILKCSGKPASYIRTVKAYENYHLQYEWRWPDSPGNSGVLLNATGKDHIWPECIESQLYSGSAGDFCLGKNTEFTIRNKRYQVRNEGYEAGKHALNIPSKNTSAELPLGEWNRGDIYSRNGHIRSYVNGTLMSQGENASRRKGKICFQSEGTPIEFRNIEIISLK